MPTLKTIANKQAIVRSRVRAMLAKGNMPPAGLIEQLEPHTHLAAQADMLAAILPYTRRLSGGSPVLHQQACRLASILAADLTRRAADKTAANKRCAQL